eukprot:sb/3466276/
MLTTEAPGNYFSRDFLQPLTLTMGVLGLISTILLVVAIFARCQRWSNRPITSDLYLFLCFIHAVSCVTIIPIGLGGGQFWLLIFAYFSDFVSTFRDALLLTIYLVRVQFFIWPSSLVNISNSRKLKISILLLLIWILPLVLFAIDRVCENGLCSKYWVLLHDIINLTLELLVVLVSVALVIYLAILYRRFNSTDPERSPLIEPTVPDNSPDLISDDRLTTDNPTEEESPDPVLRREATNTILLHNIALTLRIIGLILVFDLVWFAFAIFYLAFDHIPLLWVQIVFDKFYKLVGSSERGVELFFALFNGYYAFSISWVLILVQPSMRNALWGVGKRVATRLSGGGRRE